MPYHVAPHSNTRGFQHFVSCDPERGPTIRFPRGKHAGFGGRLGFGHTDNISETVIREIAASRFSSASPAMLPAMTRPAIAIVGAGRLGKALAMRLADAGYSLPEIVVRGNPRSLSSVGMASARKLASSLGARVVTLRTASLTADLIWFCVPDAEVEKAAEALANMTLQGKFALHSSGVLTSHALRTLQEKGAG